MTGGFMRHAWEWLSWQSDIPPGFLGNLIFVVFVLIQCLDGIFTYVGVSQGLALEGNPLASLLMSIIGLCPGIMVLKTIGVGLAMLLYLLGSHRANALLIVFYLYFVLYPWAYLFWTQ